VGRGGKPLSKNPEAPAQPFGLRTSALWARGVARNLFGGYTSFWVYKTVEDPF